MLFPIAWYNLFLTFKLALCNLVRLFWKYSSEGYRPFVDLRRNFSKPKLPANCRLSAVFYKYDVIICRFVYWQYASHCQIAGNLFAGFVFKSMNLLQKSFKQIFQATFVKDMIVENCRFCIFLRFCIIWLNIFMGVWRGGGLPVRGLAVMRSTVTSSRNADLKRS